MQRLMFQDKYPILSLEVEKSKTTFTSVDQIIEHLKPQIEAHKAGHFIAVFDHYSHTSELEDGEIGEGILDAKNIVFCFGKKIPNPTVLGIRPRSMGITEFEDKFVITFMEAPMPPANEAMEEWAKSIENK